MKTINQNVLDAFERMKNIEANKTVYTQILQATKISELMKQLAPSDMISLFEAVDATHKEEEAFSILDDLEGYLKKVRPIRQERTFFI